MCLLQGRRIVDAVAPSLVTDVPTYRSGVINVLAWMPC
jgi:hypothetical protein